MDGPEHDLIYDWNLCDEPPDLSGRTVELDDETLRDGAQSPSIRTPSTAEKIELLHAMARLGIQSADIGLPAAGERVRNDVVALAREIADQRLPIRPNCAARTVVSDIEPIVEAAQRTGVGIEASLFIGSSPIRQYVEGWSLERMLEFTERAVSFAVREGLPVMYVTEDTTRAHPDHIRRLYTCAIEAGARRVCLTDTVGHATPHGTRALVRFMRRVIAETGEDVRIDWHGHCDRGLALANSIAAIEAGADRVHGTALGVGERCGNTPMEQLLANLRLLGCHRADLTALPRYCEIAARAFDVPIPFNLPVVGADAFCTSTGVHAAAIVKARRRGDEGLADRVYSGVPASWFGRSQRITVGPMSGASNVTHWLESHGYRADDDLVARILEAAKHADRLLDDAELERLVESHRSTPSHG